MIDESRSEILPFQRSSGAFDILGSFFNDVSLFRRALSHCNGIIFGHVPFYYFFGGGVPSDLFVALKENSLVFLQGFLIEDGYLLTAVHRYEHYQVSHSDCLEV